MTIVPLKSYMRMYRKRTGLTLEEVAFLCGAMSHASVSRHERARPLPMLRTALMYELVLGIPVCEIYGGLVWEIAEVIRRRARALRSSLERKPSSPERNQKITILTRMLEELPGSPSKSVAV